LEAKVAEQDAKITKLMIQVEELETGHRNIHNILSAVNYRLKNLGG
jgi:uncharacterized coiled-coil protein SlyX